MRLFTELKNALLLYNNLNGNYSYNYAGVEKLIKIIYATNFDTF